MLAAGLSVAGAASAANCSDPPVSGNKYYVVNKDSGLQMDVGGASTANAATVLQWNGGGQANQQWTLTELSKGIWTMVAAHSSSALDLYGWDSSEDAPIKQWSYTGNSNQQWLLTANGDAYNITSNFSKKLLTVADKSAGTALKQHSKGSGLQNWYFNPVDGGCGKSGSTTGSFGSFMGHTKILIGGALDDATRKAATFDVTYQYIHSLSAPYEACYEKCYQGCTSDARPWWGCWGAGEWDWTSGQQITNTNKYAKANSANSAGTPLIQEFTWYSGAQLGEAQGALEKQYSGTDGHANPTGGINNGPLLKGYMDDYRFFLKKIGTNQNIIHLEPDFWGFIRVQSGDHPNDPHYVPAQVQSANPTDCAYEENSAAGLASCLIKMARTYAPKAVVGLHLTCWDWFEDDTATRGPKACLKYYQGLGAGKGDFLATDVTDRDAAWAVLTYGDHSYEWDDAKWKKYIAFLKLVTEGVGKPIELWQVPLGNANMTNWNNHWKDDKVLNVFNRMNDLANAHVIAVQFGCGDTYQTCVGNDGDYMLNLAKRYYANGGVSMK
ncbi:RICIN domain-containing protein [Ideonella sp. YS5]